LMFPFSRTLFARSSSCGAMAICLSGGARHRPGHSRTPREYPCCSFQI
jgi:hypothetical protein